MIKIDRLIGKINFKIHNRFYLNPKSVNELLKKDYKLYDQGIKLTFIPIKNQTK